METIEVNGYVYEIGKMYVDQDNDFCELIGRNSTDYRPFRIRINGTEYASMSVREVHNAGSVTKAAYRPQIGKLYEFSNEPSYDDAYIGVLSKINNDSSHAFIDELGEKYQFIRPVPEDKREFGV